MARRGLTLITVWEDPEVKRLLAETAKKEGRPLGTIIRGLLREWLATHKVKVPTEKITLYQRRE